MFLFRPHLSGFFSSIDENIWEITGYRIAKREEDPLGLDGTEKGADLLRI